MTFRQTVTIFSFLLVVTCQAKKESANWLEGQELAGCLNHVVTFKEVRACLDHKFKYETAQELQACVRLRAENKDEPELGFIIESCYE